MSEIELDPKMPLPDWMLELFPKDNQEHLPIMDEHSCSCELFEMLGVNSCSCGVKP